MRSRKGGHFAGDERPDRSRHAAVDDLDLGGIDVVGPQGAIQKDVCRGLHRRRDALAPEIREPAHNRRATSQQLPAAEVSSAHAACPGF
jgi:hypothetical protein